MIRKRNYNNNCKIFIKLILLFICSFLSACSEQNNIKQVLLVEKQIQISDSATNINTASLEELEKLPHIGAKKALAIVEHRAKFGNFRKSEYLLLVGGISDEQFREIRSLIRVE